MVETVMRSAFNPKWQGRIRAYGARAVVVVVVCAVVIGCQSNSTKRAVGTPNAVDLTRPAAIEPKTANGPTTTPADNAVQRSAVNAKALIDFTRGSGGFPIAADALPPSLDELVSSMTQAYLQRVVIAPEGKPPVTAVEANYPSQIESLRIDLTGARVKSEFKPKAFRSTAKIVPSLAVKHLQYVARPLQYIDGQTFLSIDADDVKLGVLRGTTSKQEKGKSPGSDESVTLVMTEAHDGRATFDVAISDLRTMFRTTARSGGNPGGYAVRNIDFAVTSDDPRSLACEMRVSGFWFLLPTSFSFSGRVDVDDEFNAHLSNVGCHGTDVGGLLFAGMVDSAIKKYDGRVMPLASFPGGKIRVRDLSIRVDDAVHIDIGFGSEEVKPPMNADERR